MCTECGLIEKRILYWKYFAAILVASSYIKNYANAFHTIKCKYMLLNVGMELKKERKWKENEYVLFSGSVLSSVVFWNCSSNVGALTFVPTKNDFSLSPFSLN